MRSEKIAKLVDFCGIWNRSEFNWTIENNWWKQWQRKLWKLSAIID